MNRTTTLLLALVFTVVLAWGSTEVNGHELDEGAYLAKTCTEWEHSVAEHRQDVFDSIEHVSYGSGEKLAASGKVPTEVALEFTMCLTDPENIDLLISGISEVCKASENKTGEEGLHLAITTLSTDLYNFCMLAAYSAAYPTGIEETY